MRAFCHWAVQQGHLDRVPFARGTIPQGEKQRLVLLEPAAFEQLLLACYPSREEGERQGWATARNRALLWVLLDTGIRVSELCALRLGDVDQTSGQLHIRGQGAKARHLVLSVRGQQQLRVYLEEHRCKRGAVMEDGSQEEYVFLTETYRPLMKNTLTLLFARLQQRAGLSEQTISPSVLRDTFAVRYVQEGGTLEALAAQLGLKDLASLKRYERVSTSRSEHERQQEPPQEQKAPSRPGRRKGRRRQRSALLRQRRPGIGQLQVCPSVLPKKRLRVVAEMIHEQVLPERRPFTSRSVYPLFDWLKKRVGIKEQPVRPSLDVP